MKIGNVYRAGHTVELSEFCEKAAWIAIVEDGNLRFHVANSA